MKPQYFVLFGTKFVIAYYILKVGHLEIILAMNYADQTFGIRQIELFL
jgi:hypothetical protein